jgi:hypothetical protein
VCRLVPFLERIERTIRPRLLPLTGPQAERVIGIVGFSLAIIIFLPIPFGNMLPGLALAILGLGLLERDGLAVLLGLLAAVTGVLVVAGVLYGLAKALYVLIFANLGG